MLPILAGRDALQYLEQYFRGWLRGVNTCNAIFAVIFEHRLRFRLVGGEATLNDLFVRIIETIVFERALLQAREKCLAIRAGKMKYFLHVDFLIHDLRLADISRNTIEDENIDVGFELVRVDCGVDRFFPKLHRDVIGDELTLARIFEKCLTHFGARIDGTEDVSAGAMEKAGNCSKSLTLRAFAAPGRTKKEVGMIFHGVHRLYRNGLRLPI